MWIPQPEIKFKPRVAQHRHSLGGMPLRLLFVVRFQVYALALLARSFPFRMSFRGAWEDFVLWLAVPRWEENLIALILTENKWNEPHTLCNSGPSPSTACTPPETHLPFLSPQFTQLVDKHTFQCIQQYKQAASLSSQAPPPESALPPPAHSPRRVSTLFSRTSPQISPPSLNPSEKTFQMSRLSP